jgi:hypothetical protein
LISKRDFVIARHVGLERILRGAELVADVAEEASRVHVLRLHVVLYRREIRRRVVTVCVRGGRVKHDE